MKQVTILGASGSIGSNAVAFLRLHTDKFWLKNVAVKRDWKTALLLCREFGCAAVSIEDKAAAEEFSNHIRRSDIRVHVGPNGAVELAKDYVDVVVAAIPGGEGLPSVLSAIHAGNRIALANKEALVCGGPALLDLAKKKGIAIIPVDSEHSAIYQSLLAGNRNEVSSILLTASGGPFRAASIDEMRKATFKDAIAHPNWRMGVKNSIDSATLANKGLELIEAAYLFDCNERDIEVVIDPASTLHSAVCYRDGSMIAQLGLPDMRTAIGYGISWPERFETGVQRLSLSELKRIEFEVVDSEKFPCLDLARKALNIGSAGPLVYNAANEEAVSAFMAGRIRLVDIASIIDLCLGQNISAFEGRLEEVPDLNKAARDFCSLLIDANFE